jgi:hypothetical protein
VGWWGGDELSEQRTERNNVEIPITSKALDYVAMASGSGGGIKQKALAQEVSKLAVTPSAQQGMKRPGKVVAVTQRIPGYCGALRANAASVRGSNMTTAQPAIRAKK